MSLTQGTIVGRAPYQIALFVLKRSEFYGELLYCSAAK